MPLKCRHGRKELFSKRKWMWWLTLTEPWLSTYFAIKLKDNNIQLSTPWNQTVRLFLVALDLYFNSS
jgi:hypothetical protein